MAFQYGAYTGGDAVKRAKKEYEALKAPASYASKYGEAADSALAAVAARGPFTYDVNGDALYRQYRDRYLEAGRRAMADTAGKAAAMTGGYANSYAASAGAQAYENELSRLNDVLPELYQLAYDRYSREGEEQRALYGLYADREARDYDRWRDENADYRDDRGFYAGRLDAERDFDFDVWRDAEDRRYQNAQLLAAEEAAAAGSGSGGSGSGRRRVYGGAGSGSGGDGDGIDRSSPAYEKDRILREFYKNGSAAFPQGMTPLGANTDGTVLAKDPVSGATYRVWVNTKGKVCARKK